MTGQTYHYEEEIEPPTRRVIEGWIGNWRISLRRRDTSAEDHVARHRYNEQFGE